MRIVLTAVVASLVGCSDPPPPPAAYPDGLGTPADPLPNTEGYTIQSPVAMPLGSAAVDDAIAQLQAFSKHGGATLLARGEDSASGQVLAALPSTLRTKLAGWIDTELDKQKLGTVKARTAVADIVTMAQTVTGQFTLLSRLTITPEGGFHSLVELDYRPDALDVVVPIGGASADRITQKPTAEVGPGGALALGGEHFTLAVGTHAWQALDLAVGSKYGGNMSIVQHLDCRVVAKAVAARCVSGSCVGHTSDIQTVCQDGLTSLVGDLRDAMTPVVLDAHVVAGTATMVDEDLDGVAEKIAGTWDAEIDMGLGATTMEIAFRSFD